MMIKYLLLMVVLLEAATAFQTAPVAFARRKSTALKVMYPQEFERAVKCAERYGTCDIDELEKLANELESCQGSFFEETEESRQKEVLDRQDIVEILRMEKELKSRQKKLRDANLFIKDVEEAHIAKREEYMEFMDEYSDY